jgi:hypothetical protein
MSIPDTTDANTQNMTAAYADPQGRAVEMVFPAPNPQSKNLQPPYISVWESPWTEGDPAAVLEQDVKRAAQMGLTSESACRVGDLPAVCVSPAPAPTEPKPGEYANGAYVRFVLGDVEIHIAGGDNVDRLLEIAQSLSSAKTQDG